MSSSFEQSVKTRITNLGWTIEETTAKNCYTVKLKRTDWHGMNAQLITGHPVCFKTSTNFKETVSITHDRILTLVTAHNIATKAWETYTDTIPYQTATGEIKTDMAFEHWLKTIGDTNHG